jgi:hypothetical protein
MSRIDSLPPDQRAVLSLLLKQGKSYDELSALLRIDPSVVEDRAHEALDALGPEDVSGLTTDHRREIADYLLGQQSASERAATRQLLESSAPGRAWARVVADELHDVAPDALPEIPAVGTVPAVAFDRLEGRRPPPEVERRPSSKLGGLVLLALVAVAIIVGIVLLASGGGGGGGSSGTGTTPRTTTTGGRSPTVEAQINLRPAHERSGELGVANIVSQGNQRVIAIVAQGLLPSPRYAVWLYNSASDAQLLGFAPRVGSNGRLQGLKEAPANLARFREILLTREPKRPDELRTPPRRPGTIVLRGSLRG